MHEPSVPNEIPHRYLPRSSRAGLILGAMVAVGLIAFVARLTVDPDRAWQAYVSNWLFFASVAQGAIILAAATTITKAKWNWSLRRIALAFGAFLPVAFVLFLPMLTLGEDYFTWIGYMEHDEIVQKKAAYLNLPFLISRNVVGLLLLFGLSLYFVYLGLRPDLGQSPSESEDDPGRRAWRERLTPGWAGREREEVRSWRRMTVLAPALVLVFAVVMSIISIDYAMSLEPHWFSMLFPGWFFMGAFWGGIGAVTLTALYLKKRDSAMDEAVGPEQLHDLGKLVFGFSIFWMYLFFSQYLVIWYGKLPWEQEWLIHRTGETWGGLSLLVIILCFVLPFAGLIGKKPKLDPRWLGTFTVLALVGLWLERYLLIAPSLHDGSGAPFTLWEPLIGLLFLGAFLGTLRWFLSTFPLLQSWQPMGQPEMVEAEVARAPGTADRGSAATE